MARTSGKTSWLEKESHANETLYWLRHHGGGNEVALRRDNLKAYRKNLGAWKVFDVTTDIGESHDIASSNAEILTRLIADGLAWSKTLLDPQWHDTENGLKSWIENKMPRYKETFSNR